LAQATGEASELVHIPQLHIPQLHQGHTLQGSHSNEVRGRSEVQVYQVHEDQEQVGAQLGAHAHLARDQQQEVEQQELELEELQRRFAGLRISGRGAQLLEEQGNPGDFAWGDRLEAKAEAVLRVGLMNINGFPLSAKARKLFDIKGFLLAYQFDVMGFTEMNTHWNSVDNANRLEAQTKEWFACAKRTSAYYVDHPFPVPFVYGGVSQWAIDEVVHRVTAAGEDPSGLGRWAWQTFSGRQGVTLRIVTAYQPVAGRGPRSVWMQQKNFFLARDEEEDPRRLFIRDLVEQIQGWLQEGNQLMVNLDANEDVGHGEMADALRGLGLEEAVTKRHGRGPATYQRGAVPIDGLFVTPLLQGCASGYVEGVSDHVALWMDIPFTVAFGQDFETGAKRKPRRLKCNDPRVVDRYLRTLHQECRERFIPERVATLFDAAHGESGEVYWSEEYEQEWEAIDRRLTAAMNKAEQGCRKL
jgi:hypothetical protein